MQWGRYPLEALAADPTLEELALEDQTVDDRASTDHRRQDKPLPSALGEIANTYAHLYAEFAVGSRAPTRAPVPDDLVRRTAEIKGAAYYLDADHCGVCHMPATATETPTDHSHAVVILVATGRPIEPNNPAHGWLQGATLEIARMRAVEIGVTIAGHIRALGFDARTQFDGDTSVDLQHLAIRAGIARRNDRGLPESPFLGSQFALVAVTTDYQLDIDYPIAADATVHPFRYWLGINGATSGRERRRRAKRAAHMSRYPMEQVKRVARPTTLILDDEVPRVPQRANFFMRARAGDLGPKAQEEMRRFAYKHPLTHGMMPLLRTLVPHQDGPTNHQTSAELRDPDANTLAIKALSYHLGADLTGICAVPDYAWYSHRADGTTITPYHKYAVVMLIDQGYDTMEGASGDDWISGCQSMRGYLRGAEIAGVMAQFLRGQGIAARAQTNNDSDVLQIPLVLLAGLGELSRIGELVLNPFVGPRFKSVVLTTDLPLVADQPIDFGLQYFCNHCVKCARECPVSAIPFGDKVMFNGYEIFKPDVERCTRYRITNPKGSACGRCMKTCPLNKVVSADGSLVHRLGTWLGINARWLKPLLVPIAVFLDDKLDFGTRNPIKRWWLDLEIVDGVARAPKATNERDLDLDADVTGRKSPVGYYNADDMPAPNTKEPVLANHKQAVTRAAKLESVDAAKARRASGGPRPAHYIAAREVT